MFKYYADETQLHRIKHADLLAIHYVTVNVFLSLIIFKLQKHTFLYLSHLLVKLHIINFQFCFTDLQFPVLSHFILFFKSSSCVFTPDLMNYSLTGNVQTYFCFHHLTICVNE
jgi:hypothetical protein